MDETCCTPEQLALIGVDPEMIAYVFTWGAAIYATFWCLGLAASAVIKALRRLT